MIDKAIAMDQNPKNKKTMDMSTLHHTVSTLEELQFRQGVQCTTCLNTTHSTIERNLHTHCTICHSKAHSMKQCEYNLLNKATTHVQQIYPENSYQDNLNRFNNRYREEEMYDNRNYSDRRSNNDWG